MMQTGPAWFMLAPVSLLLLAVIVVILFLAVTRGGRAVAAVLLGGLGLFVVVAVLLFYVRGSVESSYHEHAARLDASTHYGDPRWEQHYRERPYPHEFIPAPPSMEERAPAQDYDYRGRRSHQVARRAEITDSIPEELVGEPAAVAPTVARTKPNWAGTSSRLLDDGSYRLVVAAGPYEPADPEARPALDEKLRRATLDYIDEYIAATLGAENASQAILLRSSEIAASGSSEEWLENGEASFGPTITLHATYKIDDAGRRRIQDAFRAAAVQRRLAYAGSYSGLGLLALAALFGYLKLDTLTRGYYTGRLRVVAGAVLLTTAAVGTMLAQGAIPIP